MLRRLETVCPGAQLTVGNYTYLDGALHVQLALACDAIMQRLCAARADTALAFLCTPTDNHVITADAWPVPPVFFSLCCALFPAHALVLPASMRTKIRFRLGIFHVEYLFHCYTLRDNKRNTTTFF